MLGLHFCARAFASCGERGPLFIAVRGPLTIVASLVAEHRLQTRRLSSCGSRVQLLCGMWDLPRPGLEPVSPALAGRLSTTAPPGKPPVCLFFNYIFGYVGSSLLCAGFLQLRRAGATLRCGVRASHCGGFSCCEALALGTRAQQLWLAGSRVQAQQLWLAGSRVQAQQLWCTGLVAPQHVGSSLSRAQSRVSCLGRRILNHCATREVPELVFYYCYPFMHYKLWVSSVFALTVYVFISKSL